jgi:hypothetical protein
MNTESIYIAYDNCATISGAALRSLAARTDEEVPAIDIVVYDPAQAVYVGQSGRNNLVVMGHATKVCILKQHLYEDWEMCHGLEPRMRGEKPWRERLIEAGETVRRAVIPGPKPVEKPASGRGGKRSGAGRKPEAG